MSSANEKFSFPLLLDGSLRDGHIDAKYQSEDAPFEYDLLHTLPLVIMNENELRPIPGKNNGYYRILWQQNNIDHRSLPHFQLNDIEYINGYQLKEDIRSSVDTHSPRQLKSFVTPEKASILLQYQHANHADNNHTFNKVTECQKNLTDEQRLRAKQNTNLIFQFCSDIFNKNGAQFLHRCSLDVLDMNTLPKQYVRKQCKRMHLLIRLYERLILSLIGIHLPSNIARRIQLVLDYYEQYRSKINFNIADNQIREGRTEYIKRAEECDLVIAFKLKFIPSVCRTSFNRIKQNRPQLYKNIRNLNVYLVPKWSQKTPSNQGLLEFRLSFSVIEGKIAECRTENEKILNAVARSIYYKYIHRSKTVKQHQQYITSYFIKTCFLWMCEEYYIDNVIVYLERPSFDRQ